METSPQPRSASENDHDLEDLGDHEDDDPWENMVVGPYMHEPDAPDQNVIGERPSDDTSTDRLEITNLDKWYALDL